MAAKDSLREVPVSIIRANPAALRSVNRETEKWKEFVDSIRSKGIINPLSGRDMKDPETSQTYVGLIDGLHRFTGACEAGLETVPMKIIQASDAEALEVQIVGNIQTIETKPAQYADALKRLLVINDTLTIPQLADKLGKSETWLSERLSITKLPDKIKDLINNGQIVVSNAQGLAKLPSEELEDYLSRAMTMSPQQFLPIVKERVREVKSAKLQGRKPGPKEWKPTPFLQTYATIRDEMDNNAMGTSLLHQEGITDPLDAWALAIKWVMHMDTKSIEIEHNKFKEEEKKRAEEKAKRKAERDAKKAEEAAAVVASLES